MNCRTWNGRSLSRLMLGTVQFGMPYGVANRTGQPDLTDVVRILAAAIEGGVNCLDTAASYGASEEVLGRAIQELGAMDCVTVVTKVRPLTAAELSDPVLARSAIKQSVEESRRRLRRDCLPVVLFHREADARYGGVLEELRQRGWLSDYGVSCDNFPGPATEFVDRGGFTALQLPGNVLDGRHVQSGVFAAAKSRGIAVFVRSVYLQGLLLMPERDIPPELVDVIPARRRLEGLASEAGMDLAELALRYLLSQPDLTCVITGVETLEQIQENLQMFDRGPLPGDVLDLIARSVPELPEVVITPSQWPEIATSR